MQQIKQTKTKFIFLVPHVAESWQEIMANRAEKDGHLGPTTYTLACNDGNATSSWNQAIL